MASLARNVNIPYWVLTTEYRTFYTLLACKSCMADVALVLNIRLTSIPDYHLNDPKIISRGQYLIRRPPEFPLSDQDLSVPTVQLRESEMTHRQMDTDERDDLICRVRKWRRTQDSDHNTYDVWLPWPIVVTHWCQFWSQLPSGLLLNTSRS